MAQKRKDEKTEDRCPNCGYCPHCGQSAKPRPPLNPWPWYPQWREIPRPYVTWSVSSREAGNGLRSISNECVQRSQREC